MLANKNQWALILGGSSGFGLASANKLASLGLNICIVHRDRRGSMPTIEQAFNAIKQTGVEFLAYNVDALSAEGLGQVLDGIAATQGKIRTLLHSVAFGNLKLVVPQKNVTQEPPTEVLAKKLGLDSDQVTAALQELTSSGDDRFTALMDPARYDNGLLLQDEDMQQTIYAMGTSILSWTQAVFKRGLFAEDARVLGLTSEGNEVAWLGYAAVSAAKVVLESMSRAIAKEFGPYGIRSNIIQAGICDTRALSLIPGSRQLLARAKSRNPLGRTTCPEDVANVVALLSMDEAAWINGALIRADGGERISG